jgi:hypothetical protein
MSFLKILKLIFLAEFKTFFFLFFSLNSSEYGCRTFRAGGYSPRHEGTEILKLLFLADYESFFVHALFPQ